MATRRTFGSGSSVRRVRLVKEHGAAISQAARDLDLHENVLRKWVGSWRWTRNMRSQAKGR